MKRIFAYGNDKPVIDFSAMSENSSNRGIVLAGNYWHFKGVTIKGQEIMECFLQEATI